MQAVGYRFFVKRAATKPKIQVYAQNMPDGTVKIVAEAPKNTVQKFIRTLRINEPPVTVERIETNYTKPTGEFKFFTIKYGELAEEMAEGFGTGQSYINRSRTENKQGFQTLREEIGGLRKETRQGFQAIGDETRGGFKDLKTEVKGGLQGLGTEMKAMHEDINQNFTRMSTKYDAISTNLAEAAKAIQKESAQTRIEMIRAVDNLSKLVKVFIEDVGRSPQSKD